MRPINPNAPKPNLQGLASGQATQVESSSDVAQQGPVNEVSNQMALQDSFTHSQSELISAEAPVAPGAQQVPTGGQVQTVMGALMSSLGQVDQAEVSIGRSGIPTDPAILTGADAKAKIATSWPDLQAEARRDPVGMHQEWAPHMPLDVFKEMIEDLGTKDIEKYQNYFSKELWPFGPSTFDDATLDAKPGFFKRRMHRRLLWTVFGLSAPNEMKPFTGADMMDIYNKAEGHSKPKLGDTWFWGSGEENGHTAMFLGDVQELHDTLKRWLPNDNPAPGEPTFDQAWNHISKALFGDMVEDGKSPLNLPADDPRRLVQLHSLATGEGSQSVGKRLTSGIKNEVLNDSHRIGVILDTAGDYTELYPRTNWNSTREYFWHDAETAVAILEPLVEHDPKVQDTINLINEKGDDFLDSIRKKAVLSAFGQLGQSYGWSLNTGDHLNDDGITPEWSDPSGTINRDTPMRSNQKAMDIHCSEVTTITQHDALEGSGLLMPDLNTIAVDFETGADMDFWFSPLGVIDAAANGLRKLVDFDTFADVPQAQATSRTALFVNGNEAGQDFYVKNMERAMRTKFTAIVGDEAFTERMQDARARLDRD